MEGLGGRSSTTLERATSRSRAFVALCGALALACLALACSRAPGRPNVVVILADDLGWNDVAFTGGVLPTPHLARLASEGVRLSQMRTSSLCSPSRIAVLTGRSPLSFGIARNLVLGEASGIEPSVPFLPATFKAAGYATALVGKWHAGMGKPFEEPLGRGFDHAYGNLSGWIDYTTHERHGILDWRRGRDDVREPGYATHLLARECVRVIRERDPQKPLLLVASFTAPHTPLTLPPGRSIDAAEGADAARRVYALMVDELDRAVGEIARALEDAGIDDDTIVVFASDNGGAVRFGATNTPLRDGKASAFDGGLRVPAFVRWKGTLAPGERATPLASFDWLPTLCAAAGVVPLERTALEGVDAWPAIARGEALAPRTLAFGIERADELRYAAFDGRYKLVRAVKKTTSGSVQHLFDVIDDPGESRDLASRELDVVARLGAELDRALALPRRPFDPSEDR